MQLLTSLKKLKLNLSEELLMDTYNDKNLVIFALLLIAICLVFIQAPDTSVNIINNIISGLLGMAIGDQRQKIINQNKEG
jgi:hypothetical protein